MCAADMRQRCIHADGGVRIKCRNLPFRAQGGETAALGLLAPSTNRLRDRLSSTAVLIGSAGEIKTNQMSTRPTIQTGIIRQVYRINGAGPGYDRMRASDSFEYNRSAEFESIERRRGRTAGDRQPNVPEHARAFKFRSNANTRACVPHWPARSGAEWWCCASGMLCMWR